MLEFETCSRGPGIEAEFPVKDSLFLVGRCRARCGRNLALVWL
jgi:hypothetical protein